MFGNKKKIEALRQKIEEVEVDAEYKCQEIESNVEEYMNRIIAIEAQMEDFKAYQEHKKIMKDSEEPWADFLVEKTPEDGRLKISYDWNKAMIEELRRQGFRANTESEMVGMLFSSLVSEHASAGTFTETEMEEIKNA